MDTVAEFLTRIRNAGNAKHDKLDMPSSKLRLGIAKVLQDNGYIRSFKVARDGKQGLMRVYLKYTPRGGHMITSVQRVSRPGRRVYVGADDIPRVRSGYGMAIMSTNKGVMSSDEALKSNLGGELLCKIW